MLKNKIILIMGGTTGIGLSAAKEFIRNGAKLVIVGLDHESGIHAQKELGSSAIVLTGDAILEETSITAIEICYKEWGGLDGLYHVAGGSGRRMGDGPLDGITLEAWNKTLQLNLTSVMLSNKNVIRSFLEYKKAGSILNLGSVLGYSPAPHHFATHAYATAKAAIIGLTKSTAAFYASQNIRINVLAPGLIETPMSQRSLNDEVIMKYIKTKQPLQKGRMGRPEDLDKAACFFLSDYSAFTTGQVMAIDGGWGISEGQIFNKI